VILSVALTAASLGCQTSDAGPIGTAPADAAAHDATIPSTDGAAPVPDAAAPDGVAPDAVAPDLDAGADVKFAFDATGGWELTVYYTSVESYYDGGPVDVTGCPAPPCVDASVDLGAFPSDFVNQVMQQGTGRITGGTYAGQYLNWSGGVGYWLDVAPRDARGQALEPWVSAAADPSVPYGLSFQIAECGVDIGNGAPIDPTVCSALRAAHWVVSDRFEVGQVGAHFDLYIGEEDASDFADTSPLLISARGATLRFGP
jgi:hypothetical protein